MSIKHLFTPPEGIYRLGEKLLTLRQAEVLACHINRKAKDPTRGAILSITGAIGEKGIESHLYHLSLKLDSKGTSVQTLAKHIKDAENETSFEDLYKMLLKEYRFSSFLKSIGQQFGKSFKYTHNLRYHPDDHTIRPVLELVRPWLELSGIQLQTESLMQKCINSEESTLGANIYIFSNTFSSNDITISKNWNMLCYSDFQSDNSGFILHILKMIFISEELDSEDLTFQIELHSGDNDKNCDSASKCTGTDISIKPIEAANMLRPVHCDLKLPDDSKLLKRSSLIKVLESKFIQGNPPSSTIPLIVISGMGGTGKTTLVHMLAREWINKYPETSIWKLNAETPTSLSNSFLDLSLELCQTQEQKVELNIIDQNQTTNIQERQRFAFIRAQLKKSKKWLLIFDNVTSYFDIKDYLPQSSSAWGNGYVVITTQNSHINDLEVINTNNIITLGELTQEEVYDLFSQICFSKDRCGVSDIEKIATQDFLKNLPPFPLDISIAAHYIKNYHVTYHEYLNQIKEQTDVFIKSQENLLKEIHEYTNTRFSMIAITLKQILDKNPKAIDLLLAISILDAKNIPKDLIEKCSTKLDVNSFIRDLTKSSLITEMKSVSKIGTISIHESTGNYCYIYLRQFYHLSPNHITTQAVTRRIAAFVYDAINDENRSLLRVLESHGDKLLDSDLLTSRDQIKCKGIQGCLKVYLRKTVEAKELLKESLGYFCLQAKKEKSTIALLNFHLGISYRYESDFTNGEWYLRKSLDNYKSINNIQGQILSLAHLGYLYYLIGDFKKAKTELHEGFCLCYDTIKEVKTYVRLLRGECLVQNELGNYAYALELAKKAFSLIEQSIYKDEEPFAKTLSYFGLIKRDQGLYEEAKNHINEAINHHYQYDSKSTSYQDLKVTLAGILRLNGEYEQAKLLLNEVANIYLQTQHENPLSKGFYFAQLGKLEHRLGNFEEARRNLNLAASFYKKIIEEPSLRNSWVDCALGQLYTETHNYSEAKVLLEQCFASHQAVLPKSHPKIGKILLHLGYTYFKLGDINKGHKYLHEGLQNHIKHYGEIHVRTGEAFLLLADVALTQNNILEAEAVMQKVIKIFELHKNHPSRHHYLETLAKLCRKKADIATAPDKNNFAKQLQVNAKKHLKEALAIAVNAYPRGSKHIHRIQERLSARK